ncbi:MAG: PEP-CTERM sorting domain-containing protein [Trichodesmium sp. MO_231.B1]|nr:PEP-CTERM sorting domain-containing protein [Trichodesmium sp. MO_231.B1]
MNSENIWGVASEPDATAPTGPMSTPEPSIIGGLAVIALMLGRKTS